MSVQTTSLGFNFGAGCLACSEMPGKVDNNAAVKAAFIIYLLLKNFGIMKREKEKKRRREKEKSTIIFVFKCIKTNDYKGKVMHFKRNLINNAYFCGRN